MKLVIFLAFISHAASMVLHDTKLESEWEQYKALFKKTYQTVSEERFR